MEDGRAIVNESSGPDGVSSVGRCGGVGIPRLTDEELKDRAIVNEVNRLRQAKELIFELQDTSYDKANDLADPLGDFALLGLASSCVEMQIRKFQERVARMCAPWFDHRKPNDKCGIPGPGPSLDQTPPEKGPLGCYGVRGIQNRSQNWGSNT